MQEPEALPNVFTKTEPFTVRLCSHLASPAIVDGVMMTVDFSRGKVSQSLQRRKADAGSSTGGNAIEPICMQSPVFCGFPPVPGSIIREIHVPDGVHELPDQCFSGCKNLRCVAFGKDATLERICFKAFTGSSLEEIRIPDSVRELCRYCFAYCDTLRCVVFGMNSKLECIGEHAFQGTDLKTINIPDSVRELCDSCFFRCESLRLATFGMASSLERIGDCAFHSSGLVRFELVGSVTVVGAGIVTNCPLLDGIICRDHSAFIVSNGLIINHDSTVCHGMAAPVHDVVIPDSIREVCDQSFMDSLELRTVTFGRFSKLERIGALAFAGVGIIEIVIPERVRELCDFCFMDCTSLRTVTFAGKASKLERLGEYAFSGTILEAIRIPDSVREIDDGCFSNCETLSSIRFGASSRLEHIGQDAFTFTAFARYYWPMQADFHRESIL